MTDFFFPLVSVVVVFSGSQGGSADYVIQNVCKMGKSMRMSGGGVQTNVRTESAKVALPRKQVVGVGTRSLYWMYQFS